VLRTSDPTTGLQADWQSPALNALRDAMRLDAAHLSSRRFRGLVVYRHPPATFLHVTMIRPRPKSHLSGSTVLVATTAGDVAITNVDFRLTRDENSVTVLRAQRSPYGWVAKLDASQFSNGQYTITSVATDETGGQTLSTGVPVTVDH
jgi:hypothetical protein